MGATWWPALRAGELIEMRLSLESLPTADRHLIALVIEKGRGAPILAPLQPGRVSG